jgi:hypothetical protein
VRMAQETSSARLEAPACRMGMGRMPSGCAVVRFRRESSDFVPSYVVKKAPAAGGCLLVFVPKSFARRQGLAQFGMEEPSMLDLHEGSVAIITLPTP